MVLTVSDVVAVLVGLLSLVRVKFRVYVLIANDGPTNMSFPWILICPGEPCAGSKLQV